MIDIEGIQASLGLEMITKSTTTEEKNDKISTILTGFFREQLQVTRNQIAFYTFFTPSLTHFKAEKYALIHVKRVYLIYPASQEW